MENPIPFPTVFYCNEMTLRFSFAEEISPWNLNCVKQFDMFLKDCFQGYFIETVPSYHTITVYFPKKMNLPLEELRAWWLDWQSTETRLQDTTSKILKLPVCYDVEFALDIERIMEFTQLTYDEVVKLHSEKIYDVYLMGFLPGFPYLGVLNEALHVPRLKEPRKYVAAGTVGIGGEQTGVYPIDSPGGWNIIGKTPLALFHPTQSPNFLLTPHCKIQIERITKQEYERFLRKELN